MLKRYDGYAHPSETPRVVKVCLKLGLEEELGDLPMGTYLTGEPVGNSYGWSRPEGGHGPLALAESLAQDALRDCDNPRLLEIVRKDSEVWRPVIYKVSCLPADSHGETSMRQWHRQWSVEQHEVLSWMMPGLLKYMV